MEVLLDVIIHQQNMQSIRKYGCHLYIFLSFSCVELQWKTYFKYNHRKFKYSSNLHTRKTTKSNFPKRLTALPGIILFLSYWNSAKILYRIHNYADFSFNRSKVIGKLQKCEKLQHRIIHCRFQKTTDRSSSDIYSPSIHNAT